MWDWVWDIGVLWGPFFIAVLAVAAALAIYLLGREASWHWVLTAMVVLVVGAILGGSALWIAVNVFDAFGGPVDEQSWWWVSAAGAAILLAIFNLWRSRWWRKVIAVVAIPVFVVAAGLGINWSYGLNPTIGSIFGISTSDTIAVPGPDASTADPAQPLFETWQPPAALPASRSGIIRGGIPNTNSGFDARPAEIYLPPAALVENAPRLPLVIMMMGQPGNPDPSYIGAVLDRFAAQHNGVAPIALVIDQLGDPQSDPLCLDTELGNVETYVMQDVVPWAQANLNVLRGRTFWTVAGYSNGGQCAAHFGAKYPQTFGNILSVSPEEWPGADSNAAVLQDVFDGNQAAYDAVKPASIMAANAPYPDTVAVFTVGADDATYAPGAQRLAEAAQAAGMRTTFFEVPDADHGVTGLDGGLEEGFTVLYPRLGLAAPSDAAAGTGG